MVRYDLAFLLCCCKACLGPARNSGEEDFYDLLGVEKDATQDEIKRAYKRRSLQMHPDKLAQKGKEVTEADQARFTRMKEAYEVLSDPHRKETYDVVGERGMKWMEEPFSLDPQELAHNFATSSTVDRSKIFGIFVAIAIAIFITPVLICLQVDHTFGPDASWIAILTPLWIWNFFLLFYHIRVIMMGPIKRPDNVTDEDWIDPFPMSKRLVSLGRFLFILGFEILAALRLDEVITWKWAFVFIPVYIWEATTLFKKLPLARMRIVTVEDLENALGKPYAEFSHEEKELIAKRYSVVPSTSSPEYEAAHKLKARARQEVIKLLFRAVFILFLILQLDTTIDWNWWFVFAPFWTMSFCICCGNLQTFSEVQAAAAKRDPELFGQPKPYDGSHDAATETVPGGDYGAMGEEGETSSSQGDTKEPLTDSEREELKAHVFQAGYKMISSCCSQAFVLILVFLFVGKIQGAEYSSLWIISPLLFFACIILCLLGCTIFCVSLVDEDEMEFDSENPNFAPSFHAMQGKGYKPPSTESAPLSGNEEALAAIDATPDEPPKSTWDPERGEVWNGGLTPESKLDTALPIFIPSGEKGDNNSNAVSTQIDLLDEDSTNKERPKSNTNDNELRGPTPSEVDDLD